MAMINHKWEQLPWTQQEGTGAMPLWASLLWGPLLLLGPPLGLCSSPCLLTGAPFRP